MKELFKSWYNVLYKVLISKKFNDLINKYNTIYELSKFKFNNVIIYPNKNKVFSCFNCDYNKVKIVIIGTNPFDDKSEGLCFDSNDNLTEVSIYASIFHKNIEKYYGLKVNHDYSLKYLQEQGILLLNNPLINSNKTNDIEEWEWFIKYIISILNANKTGLIFCIEENDELLKLINDKNHYIITYKNMNQFLYWKEQQLWDLNLKQINKILYEQNGKDNMIKF